MSLRDWSALRTIGIAVGWILFVVLVARLWFFTGRTTDSEGGMAGVTFGPRATLLVLLIALGPTLLLIGAWVWQRL
jgi:hypothetical protein